MFGLFFRYIVFPNNIVDEAFENINNSIKNENKIDEKTIKDEYIPTIHQIKEEKTIKNTINSEENISENFKEEKEIKNTETQENKIIFSFFKDFFANNE